MSISLVVKRTRATAAKINEIISVVNSLLTLKSEVQSATYAPTLGGTAIGTGGSAINTATYVYLGGPNSGDRGILAVYGHLIYGTSGATFPNAPTVSLPPGFTSLTGTISSFPCGTTYLNPGSTQRVGHVFANTSATTVRIGIYAGDSGAPAGVTPTLPATWAAGGSIYYRYFVLVERT